MTLETVVLHDPLSYVVTVADEARTVIEVSPTECLVVASLPEPSAPPGPAPTGH
ncbi:MAG: hypothetical protein M3Q30_23260 [Actinomycetota bacterium]|nr:hypothetical protein [Actinomycetota bacterium]